MAPQYHGLVLLFDVVLAVVVSEGLRELLRLLAD